MVFFASTRNMAEMFLLEKYKVMVVMPAWRNIAKKIYGSTTTTTVNR